jgi:hypothetical protein
MDKTEFFKRYGRQLVKVNKDDPETGDYQLFAPEESDRANGYLQAGYIIASIFEDADGSERVELDNDAGTSFHKIGYLVLTNKI